MHNRKIEEDAKWRKLAIESLGGEPDWDPEYWPGKNESLVASRIKFLQNQRKNRASVEDYYPGMLSFPREMQPGGFAPAAPSKATGNMVKDLGNLMWRGRDWMLGGTSWGGDPNREGRDITGKRVTRDNFMRRFDHVPLPEPLPPPVVQEPKPPPPLPPVVQEPKPVPITPSSVMLEPKPIPHNYFRIGRGPDAL